MLTNLSSTLRGWRRYWSRAEWAVNSFHLTRTQDASHTPGLLLIQIDGLARSQLEQALKEGRMPFLQRLLKRQGHELHTFYSGLPASTPAVQAELHYGVKGAVPAFSYLDPEADEIGMMMQPTWAKRVEARLAKDHEGLLEGGSSWSNIYTGGASPENSHFCGASIGLGDLWQTGKLAKIPFFAILHFPSFVRLVALMFIELALGLGDAIQGMLRRENWFRELVFIIPRVFVCIGLRELITLGVKIDLARGMPIIHANFLGYDEQSHRRGPGSRFARWTLRGIDRAIKNLHKAARRSGARDYEVWIFSDHGQVRTKPLEVAKSGNLEALMRRHWPDLDEATRRERSPLRQHRTHARLLRRREGLDRSALTAFETKEFAIADMGPIGHIYFRRPLPGEAVDRLINALLQDGVPGILRRQDDEVWWHTLEETVKLPENLSLLRGPEELRATVAEDLARLVRHPFSGDLVATGWHPHQPPVSFAAENGAHAGPSPQEIQGLLIMPPGSAHWLSQPIVRPRELREAAMQYLGRRARPRHELHRSRGPISRPLRVVTYNVHYCKGLDGRFAPDRIARVLRQLDPDIVALQELDSGRERSRGEDQLRYLADELGMESCFCPSIVEGDARYGHGFLARGPITEKRQARLPDGGRRRIEPRDVMHAHTTIAGQTIALFGTHFGLAPAEQAAQINFLLKTEWLGRSPHPHPTIFMGDLNLAPGSRLYRRLLTGWLDPQGNSTLRDVQAHAPHHVGIKTFPSFLPVRRLDHIFVSQHFQVEAVHAPRHALTTRASDHLPLVADLIFHEP